MKRALLLNIFVLIMGCESLIGPKGDPGPAYPIHHQRIISSYIYPNELPHVWWINFETSNVWDWSWTGVGFIVSDTLMNDTAFYDIQLVMDYIKPSQVTIRPGDNPYTELFLFESVNSWNGMISLPTDSQKQDIILYSESDPHVYFMVKNRYNRWAKVRVADQHWLIYPFYNGSHYYEYRLVVEWYYYKDIEPDLTLHKRL